MQPSTRKSDEIIADLQRLARWLAGSALLVLSLLLLYLIKAGLDTPPRHHRVRLES